MSVLYDPETLQKKPELLEPIIYDLGNPDLPIHDHREEIIDAITNNSVVILAGPTGSGKSTQVPQFAREMQNDQGEPIFDDIIVTQPRIVAARTLSERIKEETLNSKILHRIGYYTSKEGSEDPQWSQDIALLTDGKAAVQSARGKSNNKKLLIIDEVHEWNLSIEMLVALATEKTNPKSLMYDKNLKVVIMSATMDCVGLQNHFAHVQPPLVEVSVPTYGVSKETSVDSVAKVSLQKAKETEGTVLAFLPGKREIETVAKFIGESQVNVKDKPIAVVELHGQQKAAEQRLAFKKYPAGVVVATTNVSETSITVPNAVVVADSGEVRLDQIRYDLVATGSESLNLVSAARANLDQRGGRVGRVSPGQYVLCSADGKTPLVPYENREDYALPAMERSRLDGLVLRLSATNHRIDDFKFFHKPPERAVESAIRRLEILNAIDSEGVITERGQKMDLLPLDPEQACMLVFAQEKGYSDEVIRSIVDIVSIMQTGGILKRSPKEQRWRDLLKKDQDDEVQEKDSDFIAQLEAYIELMSIDDRKWSNYDVNEHSVQSVKKNRESLLLRLGLQTDSPAPVAQENRQHVLNCINAGQLNQIWQRSGELWSLAVGNSDGFEITSGSVIRSLGNLVTGTLFSLGMRDKEYVNIQNVNTATAESLEVAAAHLLQEVVDQSSFRFSEERQEFVETVERRLGALRISSYDRVVEVAHDSPQAAIYSTTMNAALLREWSAKNRVTINKHTITDLLSMIEAPKRVQYGNDPLTGEALYVWQGGRGWVASEEIAIKSLEASLRQLERAPQKAEQKAQKALVRNIKTKLGKIKHTNGEAEELLRVKKPLSSDEWLNRAQQLLSNLQK